MSGYDILPIGWVEDWYLDALQRWASRIPDQYRDQLFGNICPKPNLAPLREDVTIQMAAHRIHPINDDPLTGRVFVYQGRNNQNKTQRLLHMRIALGAPIDATEKQHLMASDDYSCKAFEKALKDLYSGDASLRYEMSCGKALYRVEIDHRKVIAHLRDNEGNDLRPIERDFKSPTNWDEFCGDVRDAGIAKVKFVSRSRSFLHHVAVSTVDRYLLVLEQFEGRARLLEDHLGSGSKASLSDQDLSRRARELREEVQRIKDQLSTNENAATQAKVMLGSARLALSRLQRLEANPEFRVYIGSLSHMKRYEAENQRLLALRQELAQNEALLAKHRASLSADEGRTVEVEEAASRLYTALDRRGDRIRKLKPVLAAIQGAAADRNLDLLNDYERTLGVYTPETMEVLRRLHDLPVWNDLSTKMQVPTDGDIDSPRSVTYLRDEVRDLYYMVAESLDLYKEVHECVSAFRQAKVATSAQWRELTVHLSQLRQLIEALDMETSAMRAQVSAFSQTSVLGDGAADLRQQVEDLRQRLEPTIMGEWAELCDTVGVLIPKDTPEEQYSQALIKRISDLTTAVTQAERQLQASNERLKTVDQERADITDSLQRSSSPEGAAWQEINLFRRRLISLRELLEHYRNSIVVNPALVRVVLESQQEIAATTARSAVSKKQAKMAEVLTPQEKYYKVRNDLSFLGREAMEVLKKALVKQIPFAFGADGRPHDILDVDIDELTARFDGLEVSGGASSALALLAWSNEPTDHIFRTVFLVDEIGDLNSLVHPLFNKMLGTPGFGFAAMARNVDEDFSKDALIKSGGVTA